MFRRRTSAAGSRHVLVCFVFDLSLPPDGDRYSAVHFTATLTTPGAIVIQQRPGRRRVDVEQAGQRPDGPEATAQPTPDPIDREFQALAARIDDGLRLRTEPSPGRRGEPRPVVTTWGLSSAECSWRFSAQPGHPVHPGDGRVAAIIELPADTTEVAGSMTGAVEIARPTFRREVTVTAQVRDDVPFQLAVPADD
jgi:hypothetical protein